MKKIVVCVLLCMLAAFLGGCAKKQPASISPTLAKESVPGVDQNSKEFEAPPVGRGGTSAG